MLLTTARKGSCSFSSCDFTLPLAVFELFGGMVRNKVVSRYYSRRMNGSACKSMRHGLSLVKLTRHGLGLRAPSPYGPRKASGR